MSGYACAELVWGFQVANSEIMQLIRSVNIADMPENAETSYLLDSLYLLRRGIVNPNAEFTSPESRQYYDDVGYALANEPVAIMESGNFDCPSYTVCIQESWVHCDSDEVKSLRGKVWVPLAGWYEDLHDYCDLMGIQWKEPNWCLACFGD